MRYLNDLAELTTYSLNSATSFIASCANHPRLSLALFLAYCAIPISASGDRVFMVFDCGLFRFYKNDRIDAVGYNRLFTIDGNNQCFKPLKEASNFALCYKGPASLFNTMKDSEYDKMINLKENPKITACEKFASLTSRKEL